MKNLIFILISFMFTTSYSADFMLLRDTCEENNITEVQSFPGNPIFHKLNAFAISDEGEKDKKDVQIPNSNSSPENSKTYLKTKNDTYGYVNSGIILAEYCEAQKAKEELTRWNEEMELKSTEREKKIRELEEKIEKISGMVSVEIREKKLEERQKMLQEYYIFKEDTWGHNGEFYKKNEELMRPVINKINKAIKYVSKNLSLNLVVDTNDGTIFYSKPENEITSLVLEELLEGREYMDVIQEDVIKENPEIKGLKFGYISSDKVFAGYDEFNKAKEELAKWNKEMEDKALKMESGIKSSNEEIENMSLIVSKEKRDEKFADREGKVQEYHKFKEEVWGEKGTFYQKNAELIQPSIDRIITEIKLFSELSKYDLVFDANTGTLLYAKPEYEISDQIIKRINETNSSIIDNKDFSLRRIKYGFINSDKVLAEYNEAKKAKEELFKWNNEMENKATGLENEIKFLENEVKNIPQMISEEKRNEKITEIKEKHQEYYNYYETIWGNNGEFYKKNAELMQPVQDKINAIIKKISEEENYDFVCDSNTGTLLYSETQFDMTDKILKELNN